VTIHEEYFDLLRARIVCTHDMLEGELRTVEQRRYIIKTMCSLCPGDKEDGTVVIRCYEMTLRQFTEWFKVNRSRDRPEVIVSIDRQMASK